MNSATERVTRLLNGQSTRETDDSFEDETSRSGDAYDSEPTTMSRDDLKAAVKEGVTEALDEREASSETDDESAEESSSGSSRLRPAVSLLATIGTIGTIAYLRRRRTTGTNDEEDTHTQTLDDQP